MDQCARFSILGLCFILCCFRSGAQNDPRIIPGTTLDSLTFLNIPFVAVQNRSSRLGTTSDENGKFTITCSTGDTLIFSMVGYLPKKRVILKSTTSLTIMMSENAFMLKPVTVYGKFQPHGSDKWKQAIVLPKAFRNPAGPGSGYMVETFGPGYVFSGLLSRFTKHEKEKRKLKSEKQETKATETYRNLITSEEAKEYFQKTFSLSETEYSKKIEKFNSQYPEVAYLTSKEEIMKMLVNFFAQRD